MLKPRTSPRSISTTSRPNVAEHGFALVATLTLMVLLMILALSLMSLSSVTLRNSKVDDDVLEAQANARMGLMVAIGQLQKSMGPDQRISARAKTMASHPKIGITMSDSDPRAWWVGVSGSSPEHR
jgi:Tfp pilus assembly protein PilX